MRKTLVFMIPATLLLLGTCSIAHGFTSGSTGADGAFSPTANTQVQLPDSGVLNYTTVNIPSGVTVTFKKNASNTPVYILATGDVTIAGTISVNGSNASGMFPGSGGPGGFDGGLGGNSTSLGGNLPGGRGFGPGAGNPGAISTNTSYPQGAGGGGGGFGAFGANGTSNGTYALGGAGGGTYGNVNIIPLIGGSGGGGGAGSIYATYPYRGSGGGGGAGSILIASSGTITVSSTGSITANGGNSGIPGNVSAGSGGGGSGGAIKLMANTISGEGAILVNGGSQGGSSTYPGGSGGTGMIRFEANTITRSSNTSPAYTYDYPGTVFVTNIPTLKITAVGGVNVPASPTGKYGSPDITLPSTTTNPVTINISATNIPTGTTVTVAAAPEYGASTSATGTLSGTVASSTASASITLSTSYQSILTASATFTIQTAMYWDDEKIEKVRVASTVGGASETVYITESGKEIRAELLAGVIR